MLSRYLSLLLPLLLLSGNTCARSETIVVSIKPLHSLVSHLTEGLQDTHLLLEGHQSPHHLQLKPSQKRLLNSADLFIYASNSVESFVPALKDSLSLEVIALEQASGLSRYKLRGTHNHGHGHDHGSQTEYDGHIWLSVENAQAMARYLAAKLSAIYPQHSQLYQQRLSQLLTSLEQLKQDTHNKLKPFQQAHFLVYHDAFQYFEQEYQLNGAHFITTSPDHAPGIRRIQQLQQLIRELSIRCIFYEPPNKPALIDVLQEASGEPLSIAMLDPIGWQLPAGKPHYFDLMRKTAHTMVSCLGNKATQK